jgi:hypothetical protein
MKDILKNSKASACDPCKSKSKDAVSEESLYEAASDDYDYLGSSASSSDQTGMIPAAPQNEAELESYEDVFPFEPPVLKSNPEEVES